MFRGRRHVVCGLSCVAQSQPLGQTGRGVPVEHLLCARRAAEAAALGSAEPPAAGAVLSSEGKFLFIADPGGFPELAL